MIMGRRLQLLVVFLGAAIAARSSAFFDDFLGSSLNSNWHFGGLPHDYFVADSNVTVTSVRNESGEDSYANLQPPTGYGAFDYYFEDFSVRVKVTWDVGTQVFCSRL